MARIAWWTLIIIMSGCIGCASNRQPLTVIKLSIHLHDEEGKTASYEVAGELSHEWH